MRIHTLSRHVVACALFLWAGCGYADDPFKLGVVDTEQALMQSSAGKKALAPLSALMKSSQDESARMHAEIQKVRDQAIELTKSSAPGSQEALNGLQQKFSRQMEDLRRYEAEARQKIEQQRLATLNEFAQRFVPVVQAMGKELGYAMILRRQDNAVLYADDAHDLTRQVIQRLEAATPDK